MRAICLFCGSAEGNSPRFADATRQLVTELVERKIGIVYGGGKVGLMGVVAETALAAGGRVAGVIPEHLFDREVAFDTLDELHVTGSMVERKAKMAQLADGFIALPGGLGTLEEFAEVLSWAQIGLHRKPCGLFNVDGYYHGLVSFLDHAVERGFVRPEARALALVENDPRLLIERLTAVPAAAFDRRRS